MSLVSTTNWEVRTTGSANNGGGFNDRIPGTSVDYSQQNASQLSIADLACAAGSTTVTSVVGGFTNAMVGNIMRIRAGANFTVNFYEIVQFNSANSVDLDRVPVTAIGSNGVAEVGGAQIDCNLLDSVVIGGNTIHIKSGIYAAHPAVTFTNPSADKSLPISLIGYDVVHGDNPTGANRPLIQLGANIFDFNISVGNVAFIIVKNIIFEGSGTSIIKTEVDVVVKSYFFGNCKFTQLAVAGTVNCVFIQGAKSGLVFDDCEFSGSAGATSRGIQNAEMSCFVTRCYFHDLTYGINLGNANAPYCHAVMCIFAKCTTGILTGNAASVASMNNNFSECLNAGIDSQSSISHLILNNSFTDCVVSGVISSYQVVKNNNFFSVGVPGVLINLRDNNIFVNPQFVTPGSNYADQRTSGLIDKGFSNRLGV